MLACLLDWLESKLNARGGSCCCLGLGSWCGRSKCGGLGRECGLLWLLSESKLLWLLWECLGLSKCLGSSSWCR